MYIWTSFRQLYVPLAVATSCPILGDADSYVAALKVTIAFKILCVDVLWRFNITALSKTADL